MLSSIPSNKKKKLRKFYCFVSYLRKSIFLTFLFFDSHVRVDNPGGFWFTRWRSAMSGLEHIFEHLLGQFFLAWLKLKQSSKKCYHKHFSKYLPNNFGKHSNHHKNYVKNLFCGRTLHSLQIKVIVETVYFLHVSGYLAAHAQSKCG